MARRASTVNFLDWFVFTAADGAGYWGRPSRQLPLAGARVEDQTASKKEVASIGPESIFRCNS